MVEIPGAAALARPDAVTLAAAVFDEDHVASDVRSRLEPSLKDPIAVYCSVAPLAITGTGAVTAIDWSVSMVPLTAKMPSTLVVELFVNVKL